MGGEVKGIKLFSLVLTCKMSRYVLFTIERITIWWIIATSW